MGLVTANPEPGSGCYSFLSVKEVLGWELLCCILSVGYGVETLNQYGLFEEENARGHGDCWTDTLITAWHLSPGTLTALTSLFLVRISGIHVSPPDRQEGQTND